MRNMLALAVSVLLLLAPAMALGAQELPDLGGASISIAVENSYIPFSFIDQDTDAPTGVDYDVIAELCARLNCVPDFIETAWDGMILAVSNGEFDMAAGGITIKPDRAEIVDFTEGYVSVVQVLLSRIDEMRFDGSEALAADSSLLVGVQPGTTNYWVALDLVGEERIVAYETFPVAVQALIAGDVDAVVMDDVAGQGYVGVNAGSLQILGEPLTATEEIGYIFPLGSPLRDSIDAGLDSMRADGTLEAINNKWFLGAEEEALPDLAGASISIAVDNDYRPFSFIDADTGALVGWDFDIITELCARLNCVPDFVETPWQGTIEAVSNGEFDLAAGAIIVKPDRAELVDYTDSYLMIQQVLIARADESRFTDGASFAADDALMLGAQDATIAHRAALDLVGADRVQSFVSTTDIFDALVAGDVDAVTNADVVTQDYLATYNTLQILGEPLSEPEQAAFVVPPGSPLREAINAGLDSMRADGALEAINNRWFYAAAAAAALPDLAGASISIAVENSYIPFSFIDQDTDAPTGVDYDVIAELCARLNCVPDFIETAWDGMILAVSNGEFDMAAGGITIKPDRAEIVDFTEGYVSVVQVLLSRIDEMRFDGSEALAADSSLLVGVQPGTTNYWVALDLVGEERIVAYETFPVAVQALIAGDVDAVVMDDVAGQGYVGVNADSLQILGEPLTATEEIGYIFPLGSPLRDSIDAGLDSMRADGTLEAINNKWFLGAEEEALPDL